jgi:tRNA modification GTPase
VTTAERPASLADNSVWLVKNKIDVVQTKSHGSSVDFDKNGFEFILSVSAGLGLNIDLLIRELMVFAGAFFGSTESVLVTRERHRRALEETVSHLDLALALDVSGSEELIAEELRLAATTLGRLTGRVDVEDILDVIFRDFCIGK